MLPMSPLAQEIGGAAGVSLQGAGTVHQPAHATAARMYDQRRIAPDFNVLDAIPDGPIGPSTFGHND